jgi:hypothetical protein
VPGLRVDSPAASALARALVVGDERIQLSAEHRLSGRQVNSVERAEFGCRVTCGSAAYEVVDLVPRDPLEQGGNVNEEIRFGAEQRLG